MSTTTTARRKAITVRWLKARGACKDQLELFGRVFGQSAELTRTNAIRAAEAGLDLDWLAGQLLDAPLRAEYKRVTAAARAEYERVTAAAWAEYERVTAAAWAEYKRVTAAALAEYKRVTAAALADALELE